MRAPHQDKQSKQSWLDAALVALSKGGLEKVRVELLAKNLGVTKGSFYWHFKDRGQLLEDLLRYWAELSTDAVTLNPDYPNDPTARVYAVAEDIVRRELAGMDPHIRAWTQYDEKAAELVREVDKVRFDFFFAMFVDAGFDEEESEVRARLLYYYLVGEHFTSIKEPLDLRIERMRQKVKLLLNH